MKSCIQTFGWQCDSNDCSDCDSVNINIFLIKVHRQKRSERLLTNLFEEERPQPVRILQTLLQLAKEVTGKLHEGGGEGVTLRICLGRKSSRLRVHVCRRVRVSYSLCQS